jgi:ribosomal protein S18 acetylase RimI-like enzyme
MKLSNHLILSTIVLSIPFAAHGCDAFTQQPMTISVRQATLNDMDQINAISQKQYPKEFKPMWENFYVPLFNLKEDVDTRVAQTIQRNEDNNRSAIISQNALGNARLFVAETQQAQQSPHIAGFIRYERKSPSIVYIQFILIKENYRRQGVAKKLFTQAISTWPKVQEALFRAMICNKEVNELYLRLGAQQTGKICIYPDGNTSTEPDAPETHYTYSYLIKKGK